MVFRQIADIVRGRIESGEYPKGGMLPSEVDLCREFGVARTTVRRALALMEGEGLITVIPAKGRVVKSCPTPPPYLYRTIVDDIRDQIRQGELRPGDALPSEAVLRRRYAASRNTVRQALGILENDGLVIVRRGSGRFVRFAGGDH